MKNDATNKRILYIGLTALFVIFVVGIIWANSKPEAEEYNFPPPENVVEQYFTAWNNKDYVNMYATFSDGFKKIDPNAASLGTFRDYVNLQNVGDVKINEIGELSNDGQTASVDYDVEFTLKDGQKLPHKGTFTLKYRQGDVIRGWKLIHPYGENIDNS